MFNKVLASQFIFCLLCLCSFHLDGQDVSLENTESFYPDSEMLKNDSVRWAYLNVPENWDDPTSNQIKIAVAILKNTSGNKNSDAVIFIQGGPGASGTSSVWSWLAHPLRKKNDIVLFDVRGTGFCEPRLCPELGKELMKILAKNQSPEEDEKEKVAASLTCKQNLLNKNIDIHAYNSLSVAKDLNALKTQLGYQKWNTYGVSYGTYMAQVYASSFPDDIKSLLLDSSIPEISTYYTKNTTNFLNSLSIVFKECKNNKECNDAYPNLEDVFYQTIANLETNPITVAVDKKIIESEEFTYNAEDFKVAIQQALYHRNLVEVLPLLIYQFHDRNEAALGNLVAAFSSLLSMDYGVYYCVSCNEVLHNNDFSNFQKNAAITKGVNGGISFYETDFAVCNKWNEKSLDSTKLIHHNLSNLKDLNVPVLIFGGELDPITPLSNGEELAEIFSNAYFVKVRTFGHTPSFTWMGNGLTERFVSSPSESPDLSAFGKIPDINYAKDIKINAGVSSMGNSLSQLNLMFLAPLVIALLLMLSFIIVFIVNLFRGKYSFLPDKIIRGGTLLTSIIGIASLVGFILALGEVSRLNYYVLAFGLPDRYSYLFLGLLIFVILLIITSLYFIAYLKKITNRSVIISVLFSQLLCVVYFMYWGIL